MKQLVFFTVLILSITSCNNHNNNSLLQTNSDTTAFFPVNDYLSNDIEDVKKTPYLITKKIYENKVLKDSSVINAEEFIKLSDAFISKDITKPQYHALYKPSLFNDLSTRSITFTYDALRDTLPIKSISILLDDESNKLKQIFITSVLDTFDAQTVEKLIWNAGKSFSIHRSITKPNSPEKIESIFISWNDK
jgi:hypothetical protein